jgi:transcriptional regulator with XRE-family HTH domain
VEQVHGRVAFPLPGVPLKFHWVRPRDYVECPQKLGEHLRKRRIEQGFIQKEVAKQLGVNTWTYILWEQDRSTPTIRYYPRICAFLGYDPFPATRTLSEQIAAKRRRLGLSFREVADLLGVDEGTVSRWESGEWKPRMSQEAVQSFLVRRAPLLS